MLLGKIRFELDKLVEGNPSVEMEDDEYSTDYPLIVLLGLGYKDLLDKDVIEVIMEYWENFQDLLVAEEALNGEYDV